MVSAIHLRIIPAPHRARFQFTIVYRGALTFPSRAVQFGMKYEDKIVDRQVGRNGDLFAASIGEMPTKEERYPYLRILVSIVEQAHPEWNQAPTKDEQIALKIFHMSHGAIDKDECSEIVRIRDDERGYTPVDRDK